MLYEVHKDNYRATSPIVEVKIVPYGAAGLGVLLKLVDGSTQVILDCFEGDPDAGKIEPCLLWRRLGGV